MRKLAALTAAMVVGVLLTLPAWRMRLLAGSPKGDTERDFQKLFTRDEVR